MTATSTSTLADQVAEDLADPDDVQRRYRPPHWWAQSLANGALGVALLHVERARTDRAPWRTAHNWLAFAAAGPIDDGPDSHLHYGAPYGGFSQSPGHAAPDSLLFDAQRPQWTVKLDPQEIN